jgi:hypothetical protein
MRYLNAAAVLALAVGVPTPALTVPSPSFSHISFATGAGVGSLKNAVRVATGGYDVLPDQRPSYLSGQGC